MPDNPAWRLHSILKRMLSYESNTLSNRTEFALGFGIRTALDETMDDNAVLYQMFELQKLAHEVLEWIKARDLDWTLFRQPMERLWGSIMGMNPKASWDTAKKRIDPGDLKSLLYCSHEFEKEIKRNIELLEQNEMKDLVAEVDALYDAVKDSNMPEDVKTFILEQLAAIKHAIRVYPYQGYESLQLALCRSVGATMLFSGRLDEVASAYPMEVSGWKKVMGHLSTVLTKAAEVATIAEPVKPVILRLFGIDGK